MIEYWEGVVMILCNLNPVRESNASYSEVFVRVLGQKEIVILIPVVSQPGSVIHQLTDCNVAPRIGEVVQIFRDTVVQPDFAFLD